MPLAPSGPRILGMSQRESLTTLALFLITYILLDNLRVAFFVYRPNSWRVKYAAQWVATALYIVLSTISGPIGMIHPGIRGALGAGDNLAGKRGSSSGGMIAESGTVWMLDTDLHNSGDIVPDQITPASDAIHQADIINGTATNVGGSAEISSVYSRGDHSHSLIVQTEKSIKLKNTTSTGDIGKSTKYDKKDQNYPIQCDDTIKPKKDTELDRIQHYLNILDYIILKQLICRANIHSTSIRAIICIFWYCQCSKTFPVY
ncbi:MAG: hypothetical protein EZS28_033726 [Streblomastix strix]|uniref:Uncharacterized protein n=1 Tax=Streblomastix strix TaxID=222440 RepID=A0A5J4UJK9_9EUKA|nr:MAG: hypothetical protein EZS28_033726 [Streblomastix strix]